MLRPALSVNVSGGTGGGDGLGSNVSKGFRDDDEVKMAFNEVRKNPHSSRETSAFASSKGDKDVKSRAVCIALILIVLATVAVWASTTASLMMTSPIAKFALDDVNLDEVLSQRQARTATCINELSLRHSLQGKSQHAGDIEECPQVQWLAHPDHRWQDMKILVVIMATPEAVPQLDEWLGHDWLHVIIVKDTGRNNGFQLSHRHEKLARYVVELEADSPFLGSLDGRRRHWTAVARALQPLRMRNYKYTWFPETNVRMDVQSVQRMLHIAAFYDVRAGHPALGTSLGSRISAEKNSKIRGLAPVQWSGNAVEWVAGIGTVAPFFRSDAVPEVLTLLGSSLIWSMSCGPEIILGEFMAMSGARLAVISAVNYDYHSMENQDKMNACMKLHGNVISTSSMDAYRQLIAKSCPWCISTSTDAQAFAASLQQLPMDPNLPPRWRSQRFLHESRFRVLAIVVGGDDLRFEHLSGYEQFDIALVYTGTSGATFRAFSKDADFAYRLRGDKFTVARRILLEIDNWAANYEYVWFPDSNVDMTVLSLQQLVNVASRMKVTLAHPAWTRMGAREKEHVHLQDEPAFEQRQGMSVHFVNRMPMDAPLLRVDAVEYLLPTLIGDGTFLDILWPQLLRKPLTAIVDAAPYLQRATSVAPRGHETPEQLLHYGCVEDFPIKMGDKITRFQFQMLVRRNEDKDWCSIEPYRHWIDELRKPTDGVAVEEHTLAWEERALSTLRVDPTLLPLWWGQQRLAKVRGRNLIIVVAGDNSLHREWASNPSFDLCVVYFGNNMNIFKEYQEESTYAFNVKGMKWQLVRYALNNIDYRRYEYVWLPDDDITMHPDLVAKMFDLAVLYDVRLGQPAVHSFGAHYHHHVVRGNWSIHFVNFIEIMVPLLRVDSIEYLFPLWNLDMVESGYGLDSLWPQFLRRKMYGVFDATPCNHTGGKIMGGRKDTFYSRLKMDPVEELRLTMTPYDCFELWNVTEILGHVTIEEHNAAFPKMQLTAQRFTPGPKLAKERLHVRDTHMVKLPSLKAINKVQLSGSGRKTFLLPRRARSEFESGA
ncbi:Hypothetical Protein FCC1311_105892 [Hondaea fermentalgiana]|uniref:Uncharacterized protein n=1 Tax=Hondaea fermentalgiana TaxID=2315210 RepID=A0A2R5GU19_9STRA|nr:Hypothetical Protein FCC1311_105892 [Hondaea fermentalgiana]|eukprot:GBG34366.1 Hypothetical Protein FCC1311_105892 [Hondaea fermentalgiana]